MSTSLPGHRRVLLLGLALLCAAFARAQFFPQPTVIPTGNWPAAIYTADINGDGFPDLIYLDPAQGSYQSTAHILLGDGHGSFSAVSSPAVFGHALAIGDFLVRGNPQIAFVLPYATPAGSVISCPYSLQITSVVLSGGSPAGSVSSTICAIAFKLPVITNLTKAHLHPSGDDLLFTDSANGVLYDILPAQNGSQNTATTYPLQDGAGPIAVADLNNDGRLDVVVNGQSGAGAANVFLNTGNGLLPAGRHLGNGTIHSLLLQDVNFDGRPDLIAEGTNGHIDVFPGKGDGTFDLTSIGGTGPLDGLTGNGGHLIVVADLNHDGQLDALTATPAGISTLFGAGTSYLKLGGIYNAGPGHTSYATADFNGDGNLDLAVDSPEGIAILYGNADGTFQTSRAYAAGAPALSGALGAFTASGKLDAVVSTAATQGQLLLGAGDGTFAAASAPTTTQAGTPRLWSTVQAADFDADGKLDLLFTADGSNANLPPVGSAPGIYLQHGAGDGTFANPVPVSANVQFTYPSSSSCAPPFDHFPGQFFGTSVVADFNADGIPDFANRDAAAYRIFRGNNGSASNSYTIDPTLYSSGVDGIGNLIDCNPHAHDLVATGDFDHDGHADLVFQGSLGNSGALLVALAGPQLKFPVAGDLSIDGSLTTPGQLTAPNLSATFGGISPTFNQPYFPGSITTADLDHDGNVDLLVTYANLAADPTAPSTATPNYLYIWFGSGGGKFLTSAAHPVNPVRMQLSRNYYQVAVADITGDGIADLILSDGYLISYRRGTGTGDFGPELHVLAGRGINTIKTSDLRGIGVQDVVIANGGAALANPVVNHETLAADPEVNTGGITVLLATPPAQPSVQATLSVSPEPSVFYSPYTITVNGTGNGDGDVNFIQDGVSLGVVRTVNSIATFTVPAGNEYLPGQHSITATYRDLSLPGGTGPGVTPTHHIITRAPTTVTLTPTTASTVYYGQGIDGTFAVSVIDSNYPATGLYTLLDNGIAVPSCTALPLKQTCPYGNPILLDAGPHSFSINYLGDPVNAPASSPQYLYTILPDLTTISLASSSNPAFVTQAITLTARVTGNFATPTGQVTFSDGGQINQTALLVNGVASIQVNSPSIGTHNLVATYPGNQDFNPATSAPLPQVIRKAQANLSLTSSLNPATVGDQVTFYTSSLTTPSITGTIQLYDGTQLLASLPLTNGAASFITSSLAVGTHPITATYAGDANYTAADSASLNQVIQAVSLGTQASITTLTSNLNPSAPQQLITLTATVAVPGVFITVPAGQVTFLESSATLGTITLGTGTLNSFGVATFQTSSLATGTHLITAAYAGLPSTTAPTILPSVSNVVQQVVTVPFLQAPPGFVMTVNPTSLSVNTGSTGLVAVNILAVGGFNQPVALSCSHLAPETTCIFSPSATVPPGGGNVTLQLFTNAPRDCGSDRPYLAAGLPSWPLLPGGLATAALFVVAVRRRRIRALLLLSAAAALTTLSGCGHCTDLGTRPGNYTFQITATAQGVPITETTTATVPLTVTIP